MSCIDFKCNRRGRVRIDWWWSVEAKMAIMRHSYDIMKHSYDIMKHSYEIMTEFEHHETLDIMKHQTSWNTDMESWHSSDFIKHSYDIMKLSYEIMTQLWHHETSDVMKHWASWNRAMILQSIAYPLLFTYNRELKKKAFLTRSHFHAMLCFNILTTLTAKNISS